MSMQRSTSLLLALAVALLVAASLAVPAVPLVRRPVGPSHLQHHTLTAGLPIPQTVRLIGRDAPLNTVPLYGNLSLAVFFAPVSVGTPPQQTYVQVDTGSSDFAVYGTACGQCGPSRMRYNPSQSSTIAYVSDDTTRFQCDMAVNQTLCGFKDVYGDGSFIQGAVATETFALTGSSATLSAHNVSFGVVQSASANYEPGKVDGIWGLAYSSISEWNGVTVFEQISRQTGIADVFGMCLQNNRASFLPGVGAPENTVFTPVIEEQYYTVYANDVKVAGQSIGVSPSVLNDGGTIVDSGTTLMVVATPVWKALRASFSALCSQGTNLVGICNAGSNSLFDGSCYQMSESDIAAFPTVSVNMRQAGDLNVAPATYLQQIANTPGYYCLAMADGGNIGIGLLLGDTFMANYRVTFDRANSRLGFSPVSTCP